MAIGGMAQSTFLAIVRGDASQAVTEFNKLGRAVEKSTTGAGQNVSKFKTLTNGAFAQIKANAGLMAAGAGAAIAGFAIKAATDFANLGVAVGKFADATGMTTEAASRFIEVAGDINVDIDALEGGINKMNKALGTSPAKFEALGVEIVRTKDGAVDMSATFLNAIDVVNGIEDPTKKATVATALFGRGWTSMAELIAQGSDQIAKSMAEVDASKIMTDEDVAQGRRFRDMVKELSDQFEEFSLIVGESVLPALTDAVMVLGKLADALKFIPGGFKTASDAALVFSGSLFSIPDLIDDIRTAWLGVAGIIGDDFGAGSGGFGAGFRDDTGEVVDALSDAEVAFRNASKAADDYRKAIEDAYHAERAILDGTLDYKDAVEDAQDAVDESNKSLVDTMATQEEQNRLLRSARDEMIAASEAFVEMHGASLDSATGIGMQIAELERLKESLGANDPLRMLIDEYIAQLKLIPQSIATRLELRVSKGKVLTSSGDVLGWNPGSSETPTARASGGPVRAGGTYLIGEEGPELVTMGGSGFVTPNDKINGSLGAPVGRGGGSVTINVYPRTMPTQSELAEWIRSARRRGEQI